MATPLGNSDTASCSDVVEAPARRMTVLLVSTRENTLADCAHRLEEEGFRTMVARTGFEAIVKACWHLPDVIVLQDGLVAYEGVDGSVAAHLIRICPSTAHIPILSGETVDLFAPIDPGPPQLALLSQVARDLSSA